MARTLTPQDCHVLMNLLVAEATGQDATIQTVDSSNFVSAGETVLATGVENTLNTLALVLGRTFMAVRPYKAKMRIVDALNTGAYTSRCRKISFYSREAQASGDWNTQLYNENLYMGEDNGEHGSPAASTKSMWVQNQPVVLEMNFGGQSVWQDSTTIYEIQLQKAFRSEAEFSEFVSGIMTEKGNDIESQKEAFNRMGILNHIAGVYDLSADMPGSVINLTAAYNARFLTSYTTQQLLTTYLDSFLKFFVSTFKITSDYLTERSAKYHWSPAKTVAGNSYTLLRHTPKDRQKAILYGPLFKEAEAWVLPEIFNPQYLSLDNYESVTYWQNINDPSAIDVTPAIPDTSTGIITVGSNVSCGMVVGMLFDEDALMVDYQLEAANTTPLEARKSYRNLWWTFSRNYLADFSENCVIFIMEDTP